MTNTASNRREQLRRQQEAQARARRNQRVIGVAAALVALVLVGVLVYVLVTSNAGRNATGSVAQITPALASEKKDALVVAKGNAGTPTVTLYLDYQCPNCRTFEENFGQMLADTARAGEWTLQYKTMIFMDKNLQNTASSRSAFAAACAADTDKYEEYHQQVYANQALQEVRGSEGYSDPLLRETIPGTVGITGDALTRFQACYDGRATRDFVTAVDKSAYSDGVQGTPTLAVNGKVLSLQDVPEFTPEGVKKFILDNA